MNQISILHRLQQTDSTLDKTLSRLQIIQAILDDDTELLREKEKKDNAAVELKSAQELMVQTETIVNDLRIKIEQMESNLYGGTIHVPKELQDVQNDIASLKRRLAGAENHQLEAMIANEKAEALTQSSQRGLGEVSTRVLQQNQTLTGERGQLQKDLDKKKAERMAITAGIPPDLLDMYEALRKSHHGLAVASISENSCSACGTGLTPAQIQTARLANELAYCPTCGRILFGG